VENLKEDSSNLRGVNESEPEAQNSCVEFSKNGIHGAGVLEVVAEVNYDDDGHINLRENVV